MEPPRTFEVEPSREGERLDRFLASANPDLSRARVQQLIDENLAAVNGAPAKASRRLKAGERVHLTVPEIKPVELAPDRSVRFDILYEDEYIVVIDKPAGLVVHPAAGHQEGTLVHGLLAACPDLEGVGGEARPGIVHRLDKDTSGVMVAAKTDAAHQGLVRSFQERTIRKTYLAFCLGRPPALQGVMDEPIGRHPVRRKEMSTRSARGRAAVTRYEVLKIFPVGASLLSLDLMTGRTHQIRVHLASLGCPVLGDPVYGRGLGGLKNRVPALNRVATRQLLHAYRLGLIHPVTGETMLFTAPWPADFRQVLEILESSAGGGQ